MTSKRKTLRKVIGSVFGSSKKKKKTSSKQKPKSSFKKNSKKTKPKKLKKSKKSARTKTKAKKRKKRASVVKKAKSVSKKKKPAPGRPKRKTNKPTTKIKPNKKPTKKKTKKSAQKKLRPSELKAKKPIGRVTHFFGGIKVAIIKFNTPIATGEKLRFKGATTDFTQKAGGFEHNHKPIKKAPKGKEVGLKVSKKVREGDEVYKG